MKNIAVALVLFVSSLSVFANTDVSDVNLMLRAVTKASNVAKAKYAWVGQDLHIGV